jgi:hypothetical protein
VKNVAQLAMLLELQETLAAAFEGCDVPAIFAAIEAQARDGRRRESAQRRTELVSRGTEGVVLDADPLARIGDIARVTSTLRAGVVFDSAAVYETVSVRPLTEPAQHGPGSL